MGRAEVVELESRLQGLVYDRAALAEALADVDMRQYFGEIDHADVLGLLAP